MPRPVDIRVADLPLVTELNQSDVTDHELPPLSWGVTLPDGVAESLVVNTTAIRRIHRVGAFAASIVSEYQGDTTEYSHNITSVGMDGSATAGRSMVTRRAELGRAEIHYRPDVGPNVTYGMAVVRHSVNRAEIASRISDEVRVGTPRPEAWASVLDASLRESYEKAAREHLLRLGGSAPRIAIVTMLGPAMAAIGGLETQNPVLVGSAVGVIALANFAQYAESMELSRHLGKNPIDKRWSIIPGKTQPDRYALTRAALATHRLIKPIN